ncbi:TPA: hypothetical protein R7B83_003086 [Klebsiella pneumoniae]|nr:hypothetical protein [Klebsiella pneumoniae]
MEKLIALKHKLDAIKTMGTNAKKEALASMDDFEHTLWCLGSLLEQRYGELKEGATLCIKAKRFTATIQRTQDEKPVLIKKGASERMK